MNNDLIQRYQRGGDIYATLAAQYGIPRADAIAAAARTGDRTAVTAAIAAAKYGSAKNESTADIFFDQLATNPLGAPLESANRTLGNTFLSFLKSPWVIVGVAVVIFASMGGFAWLGKKVFKA